MRYLITADRNYDNTQVIYNFLINVIKPGDEILITSDHKYEFQEIVALMSKQLGLNLVVNKEIVADDNIEIIKLEDFEESLGVENV